jgi:hypothetical protein
MKHRKLNVEKELRASRSAPRAEFAQALVDEVRSSRPARSPLGRVGLALALSGLIVIALASFGGIGYASSSASHAVKKPAKQHVRVVKKSAAHAQYAPFTPPAKPKPKPETNGTTQTGGTAGTEAAAPPKVKSAQLPFTGLALWVPFAVGMVLVSIGLVLRTRARRRDAAH